MWSRPFRVCLSLFLMLALMSMLPSRAAMAMPTGMSGSPEHMHTLHGQMQMADDDSSQHTSRHGQHNQHDQCPCGAHCGVCGACHSAVSADLLPEFIAIPATPKGPGLLNPAEIWLPLDPRPPRA